jgi:hypothetical protein
MKRTIWMTVMVLMLTGATRVVAQQSLGDYARKVRQEKSQSSPTSRQYDNDNLPTAGQLSVVGPAPSAQPVNGPEATKSAAPNSAVAQADKQKAGDDLKNKMKEQQDKIDAMTHELDLDQREYRLRAAAFYGDAGTRLRDSAQWAKDDAQYRADMDAKQKAIDEAKQQLNDLQEQARKAGVKLSDAEQDKTSDKDKEKE